MSQALSLVHTEAARDALAVIIPLKCGARLLISPSVLDDLRWCPSCLRHLLSLSAPSARFSPAFVFFRFISPFYISLLWGLFPFSSSFFFYILIPDTTSFLFFLLLLLLYLRYNFLSLLLSSSTSLSLTYPYVVDWAQSVNYLTLLLALLILPLGNSGYLLLVIFLNI